MPGGLKSRGVDGQEACKIASYLSGALAKPSTAQKGPEAVGALQHRALRAVSAHLGDRLGRPLATEGPGRTTGRPTTRVVASILHERLADFQARTERLRAHLEVARSGRGPSARQRAAVISRRELRLAHAALDRLEKQFGHTATGMEKVRARRQILADLAADLGRG